MFRYLSNVVTLDYDENKCTGCGMCITVCPHAVFSINENKKASLDNRDACMECGACARNCPANAIKVKSGVGCATGIIFSALGVKNAACCSDSQCSNE